MKRWRVLFLMAGIALVAFAVLKCHRRPQEPVYQEKPLTQWINEAHDVGIFEQTDETKNAMLTLGTNAVPFLMKEFTRPISSRRDRFFAWVNSHSFFRIHFRTDEERFLVAYRGLRLLETNAAPALPVLGRYLDDPIRDEFVMDIFCDLGDAALPYVTAGLATTNAVTITNALRTLQRMARRSDPARGAFATALNHPSPTVRAPAEALRKRQGNTLSRAAAE
jgi:hypothetical protein